MANFDFDAYLQRKRDESGLGNPPVTVDSSTDSTDIRSKLIEVTKASTEKIQQLAEVANKLMKPLPAPGTGTFEDTLISKVAPLNPNGVPQYIDTTDAFNTGVNTLARATAATSRVLGNLETLPAATKGAWIDQNITDAHRQAYDRVARSQADPNQAVNPGDMELLNSSSGLPYSTVFGISGNPDNPSIQGAEPFKKRATQLVPDRMATYGELMDHYQTLQKGIKSTNDARDISSIVHHGEEDALSQNSRERFDQNKVLLDEAIQEYKNGNKLKAAALAAEGGFNYAENVVRAVVDNPRIILSATADNVPQLATGLIPGVGPLALGAVNAGYGVALDAEGKANQTKETGLPYGDLNDRSNRTLAATGAAALELVGNIVPVQGLKNAAKAVKDLGKPVAAVAEATGKSALKEGAVKTAAELIKTPAVEGLTEHLQSPLENIAERKPYDAFDQFMATVMGVGGGIGMGSHAAVVTGLAKGIETAKENKALKDKESTDFFKAVTSGDTSIYTDEKSPSYDLSRAAGALVGNSFQEGTTQATREENLTKVGEFKTQIEQNLQAAKDAEDAPLVKTLETQLKRVTFLQERFGKDVAISATQEQTNAPEGDLKAPGATAESRVASLSESMGINEKHAAIVEPLIERALQMRSEGATAAQTLDSPEVTKGLVEIMRDRKDGDKSAVAAVDLLFRRIDQIHAETGSLVTNQRIANEITNNRNPELRHALDWIATDTSDPGMAMIAGAVSSVVGDTPIKFDSTIESGGLYDGGAHQISINPAYQEGGNVRGIGAVVLHEGTHAATMKAIYNNEKLHKALFDLMEHVAEQNPKLLAAYGMKTTLEFLSEGFSNKSFQEQLHAIKASSKVSEYLGETIGDAWNQFVTLVREALNIPAEYHSSLTQLLELGGRAMKETQSHDSKNLTNTEVNQTMARGLVPQNQMLDAMGKLKGLVTSLSTKEILTEQIELVKEDTSEDGYPVLVLHRLMALIATAKVDPDAITADLLEESLTAEFGQDGDTLIGSKVEGVTSETKEETNPGKLSIYNDEKAPEGTPFNKLNLITTYFKQVAGGVRDGSIRPLVAVKDFLTQLGKDAGLALDYLKQDSLTEAQSWALEHFISTAKAWNKVLGNDLFKSDSPDHYYKNMTQFIVHESKGADGKSVFDSDENFKTAISFAAYSLILDMASKGAINDNKTINAILGRHQDWWVDPDERKILGKAGTRDTLLVNAAGKVAYEALGFKANKETAPSNLEGKLQAELGGYVIKLLVELKHIKRTEISTQQMAEMMGSRAGEVSNSKSTQSFFTLDWDDKNKLPSEILEITDSVKGSQSVLDKLFSVESLVKMPGLVPFKFMQEGRAPKELADILKKKLKEKNYLRDDMWHLLDAMSLNTILNMAGEEEISDETTPHDRHMSIQAKNESLVREYERYLELGKLLLESGEKSFTDVPFFLDFNMWKEQRVGISVNGFNPQGSKLQRNLTYQKAWETKIDLRDVDQVNNFLLRVAEGLGVKTDAALGDVLLANKISEMLRDETLVQAVEILRQRLEEKPGTQTKFTAEQEAILMKAVKGGKEKMHSLNSLVGLAHFEQAKREGKSEFPVQIPAEVDGKTNGAILGAILFGAAATGAELTRSMERGGFFSTNSRYTQYNQWKSNPGNYDVYENTIKGVMSKINERRSLNPDFHSMFGSVEFFTGNLTNKDTGAIESAGRKIIKGPVTEIVFGSAVDNTIKNMAGNFVDSVYDKISEAAKSKDPEVLAQLIKHLNALLQGTNSLSDDTTIQEIIEHRFSKKELQAIRDSFMDVFADSVGETIREDFADFLAKRAIFNNVAQSMYTIYNAAYQQVRKEYIKEQLGKNIAVSTTTITDKETGAKRENKKELHDLTREQEQEVRDRVLKMFPQLHTLFSQNSADLNTGLDLVKSEREISTDNVDESEMRFNTPFSDTTPPRERMRVRGMKRVMASPGVGSAVLAIHSLDSYISHMVQKTMDVLNQHDAVITGVGQIREAAVGLNSATWDGLFHYSPPTEMFNSLMRSMTGLEAMLKDKNTSPEVKEAIAQAILDQTNTYNFYHLDNQIKPENFLYEQMLAMNSMRVAADHTKFQFLSTLASIDQYTFEGGAFEVTDTMRAAALKELKQIKSEPSREDVATLMNVQELLAEPIKDARQKEKERNAPPSKTNEDITKGVLNFTNAQAMQLLDQAIKDTSVSQDLRVKLNQIFKAMREMKQNLREAVISTIGSASQGGVIQFLSDRFNQIPASLWGMQGNPQIASDKYWTDLFDSRGNLTGKQLVQHLRKKITEDGGPKNIQAFNLELLKNMEGILSPNLTIRYVTPATAPEQVLQKAKEDSRAWFVAVNDTDVIYVLSPDFIRSGVTTETLMHELLHAALARTLQVEREKQAKDSKYTSHATEMMADLETLRSKAKDFIAANPELAQYTAAVENIDELISWGMTNQGFQREVLNKITMQSKTSKTLIEGMKVLIDSLVGLLFRNSSKTRQAINVNGMTVLITNVSGLFTHAANTERGTIDSVINLSQKNPPDPAFWTTTELYEGLGAAPTGFDPQLRGLLNGIVNKLHGTGGVFHSYTMRKRAISERDVYLKAILNGEAPFASSIIASGFKFSEQEQFVMEQVEATVRAAINRNLNTQTFAYDELERLYKEAKTKLTPASFYDGNWSHATVAEKDQANKLYDFLFELNPLHGSYTEHLSRFAAMGLANQQVNKALKFKTDPDNNQISDPSTFLGRLNNFFEKILNWFQNKITGVVDGEKADQRLKTLSEALVSIESKKRRTAMANQGATFAAAQAAIGAKAEKLSKRIEAFGQSPAFSQNRNGWIRALGGGISNVAAGRVDKIIDQGMHFRDKMQGAQNNIFTDTVNYVRGPLDGFEELFRLGKKLEGDRKDFITQTAKNLLEAFENHGLDLTPIQKQSVTMLLRMDAQSLLQANYTLDEIHGLLGNGLILKNQIKRLEDQLDQYPDLKYQFIMQSKDLAHHLMVGGAKTGALMLNAGNIAKGYGTQAKGRISEQDAAVIEKILDPLISMYAIQYAPTTLRVEARILLKHELDRNGENGIEVVLKTHQFLLKDAKEKLFDNSEALVRKGYLPEVHNPRTQIEIATKKEGEDLKHRGFSLGSLVYKDKSDQDQEEKYLWVLKDVGMMAHPTGMMSTTDQNTKGESIVGKNRNINTHVGQMNQDEMDAIAAARANGIRWMKVNGRNFDPMTSKDRFMVPVVNPNGDIVNYRYMMDEATRDSILERNNDFEHLLGVLAGNTFDKVTSAEHNKKVVRALFEFHEMDYLLRPESYIQVGADSKDPANKEIYKLLPEETKKYIKQVWGKDYMMVRNDMMNLTFGYRKYSLSDMWNKEFANRNVAEKFFTSSLELVLSGYARMILGKTIQESQDYAKIAQVAVRRKEDAWKYISDQVKNNIVVKTGKVLLGNIWSNATLLMMHGIPLTEIASTHAMAFRAARQYQEMSEQLFALQQRLDIGVFSASKADIEKEILILKNRIARNPVTELIDAGLMPTIVRDINFDEDKYAYKTAFEKRIESNVADLDPLIQKIGKNLYMTKDTPHYKLLADVTQLSDFVARYTLYQHLTTKADKPMGKKEALRKTSESFVNYDIPLPRGIQYLDDMGLIPFTKYFLSMQRILLSVAKEHPIETLKVLMANNYLHLLPTVMDTSMTGRFGHNPFYHGSLRLPQSVAQILPIKMAISLFR